MKVLYHITMTNFFHVLNNVASSNFKLKISKVGTFYHSNSFQITSAIYMSGRVLLGLPSYFGKEKFPFYPARIQMPDHSLVTILTTPSWLPGFK
jgi:hypothetical protein